MTGYVPINIPSVCQSNFFFFSEKIFFPFCRVIIKLHRRASVGRGCALTYNSMNPRSRLKIFVRILLIFSLLLVQFGSILSFRDLVNRICEASFNWMVLHTFKKSFSYRSILLYSLEVWNSSIRLVGKWRGKMLNLGGKPTFENLSHHRIQVPAVFELCTFGSLDQSCTHSATYIWQY